MSHINTEISLVNSYLKKKKYYYAFHKNKIIQIFTISII